MMRAKIAPAKIDNNASGILKNIPRSGARNLPPKYAAKYAAMRAANRATCRGKPRRQPRKISNTIKTSANETKTSCQSGEPAAAWSCEFICSRNQLRADGARDRKEQAPPSPRPLELPAARHTDRDDHEPQFWFVRATH